MTKSKRRWLGIVLIAVAVAGFLLSVRLEDVPGPMQASKPEVTFSLYLPLGIPSIVLGLAGMVPLALSLGPKQ
jgi:hypothetical protein